MPWKHEGRRVRITRDLNMGELGGLVRRGEKGTVTFADRKEGIFEVALDVAHPGLEDNILAFSPLDEEDPALERDRLSEAMCFVRDHAAVMVVGGFIVGFLLPIQSPSVLLLPTTARARVMEYNHKLYRLTVEVAADGSVSSIKSIEPIKVKDLPQVD